MLVTPDGLRVVPVRDLDQRWRVRIVNAVPLLRDKAFDVLAANLVERVDPVPVDEVHVQHTSTACATPVESVNETVRRRAGTLPF